MSRTKRGLPAEPRPRRSAAAEQVATAGRIVPTDVELGEATAPKPQTTRRITLDLDAAVIEDLKGAVVYLQHTGHPEATQVGIVATAVRDALVELLRDHKLEHFPPRGRIAPKPGCRPK